MQHVHHLLGQLDERLRRIAMAGPVIRVRVLDHVAAAVLQGVAKQRGEADQLVIGLVAADIEDDAERSELLGTGCEDLVWLVVRCFILQSWENWGIAVSNAIGRCLRLGS